MRMRVLFVVCLLAAVAVGNAGAQRGPGSPKILEFDTMVGVTAPYTGSTNPIRGVNGGGLPWMLTAAKGELGSDGYLEVRVRGLVLAAGGSAGTNPQANFRAIVSCLTTAGGNAVTSNTITDPFPATMTGDSDIETFVSLPSPCIAPIVFVTSGAGTAWFAATGR